MTDESIARVGIMSMQRIRNYGSSLQAYALARLIEDLPGGADVSFLDYRPGPPLAAARGSTGQSRLGRVVSKVREYNAVDAGVVDRLRFLNHKRAYGAKYFSLLEIGRDPGDVPFDVQVIGSDEVFNCVQSNTNVGYSRDLFGRNARAPKVISYAASFGNTTLERIEKAGIRAELEADLATFSALSVRDRNSAAIVHALTGSMPPIHVDPVLAYEHVNVEHGVPPHRLSDAPYVVVYGYAGRFDGPEGEAIRGHARRLGARVLCFGGVQSCADRFVDCDPFELLAYFRDAEAVVTDTFHGTIFSIINHVPFATIVRPSQDGGYGNEEKLAFLLEMFGLDDRRLSAPVDLARVLGEPIDGAAIEVTLQRERARSVGYLTRQIVAD